MTGSFTVSGVSATVLLQPGASALFSLIAAIGDDVIGSFVLEESDTGGQAWRTSRTPGGVLLSFTGTVAVPLTLVAASYTVKNETTSALRYRVRAFDMDAASDAIAYTLDPGLSAYGEDFVVKHARAVFDPSANSSHRSVAAHGLGVTIPSGAVLIGGFVDVLTTMADVGTDTGTIALKVQTAGDLVAANDIGDGGNPWDAGVHAFDALDPSTPSTFIKLTAAREITATVAVAALATGKLVVHVLYVE